MTEAVIVALITAFSTITCQWLINKRNSEKDQANRLTRQQQLDDRLDALTSRVDEHNNYAKMFQSTTESIRDIATDVKLLSQDVKYLKEGKFKV